MKLTDSKILHDYCMAKPCAYETRPFGEYPICYRVAGKIFAQFTPSESWFKLTLKTTPEAAEVYRRLYPGIVVRGYHCPPVQQPYWNTLDLLQLNQDVVLDMIDEAYDTLIASLPKKVQRSLTGLANFRFIKTNSEDPAFITLCEKLDQTLSDAVGAKKQEKVYAAHNNLNYINDVFLIYDEDTAIGCGAYKMYDEETVEVKRIFISPDYRGMGLAKELLRRLEADARIGGFRYAVLETNRILTSAVELYHRMGYKDIPNYPPYTELKESVCMKRKL